MPKLQKKTIRLVCGIYALILLVVLGFSYFGIFLPLQEQAIDGFSAQHAYVSNEADAILSTIREYASYAAHSKEILALLKEYLENPGSDETYELSSGLNYISNIKSGVRGIVLQGKDAQPVYSLAGVTPSEKALLNTHWYQSLHLETYGNRFSPGIMVPQEGHAVQVIAFSQNYNIRNLQFTLTLFLDYTEIFGNIQRYCDHAFDQMLWIDQYQNPLFDVADTQPLYQEIQPLMRGEKNRLDTKHGIYLSLRMIRGGYTSVVYISQQTLRQNFSEFLTALILFLLLFLAASLGVAVKVVSGVTNPICELSRAMHYAVENELNVHTHVGSEDEIGELSATFNQMMDEIKTYLETILKKEEQAQGMRFGLLISQIDPHFICNTLNTSNYLARQNRTDDVVIVNSALINLLRDRLRVKDFQIYDTVAQEIHAVKQYLTIQEYRYGQMVQVVWEIDAWALEQLIPKNIIQPLVENALFHGLSDGETGEIHGMVKILVKSHPGALTLQVQDNGRGMTPEKIAQILHDSLAPEQLERGHGIGIAGVRQRIEILYGTNGSLLIESGLGEGTNIQIELCKNETEE